MKQYIKLWENEIPELNEAYGEGENLNAPSITPYLLDDGKKHSCIIVVPGGGFVKRCPDEGETVAKYLNQMGMSAFVLNYRVKPYLPNVPYIDAQRAVQYVRYYSERFNVFEDQIGMIGFSAGSNITCTVAENHEENLYEPKDEIGKTDARPNCCILCYGNYSFKKNHISAKHYEAICHMIEDEAEREAYCNLHSCENNVPEDMPPTFIWHCVDDKTVSISGAIELVKALQERKIPYEVHFFPSGGHGKGIERAMQIEGINEWPHLCENWLKHIGFLAAF